MKNTCTRYVVKVCLCFGLFALTNSSFAQRIKGFDVSQFQGNIDWAKAYNQGIRFAFIRADRGGPRGAQFVDTNFHANMAASSNITVSGQPVTIYTGNYHFARPDTFVIPPPGTATLDQILANLKAHAESEAEFFYGNVSQYLTPGHLRPVLDVEVGSNLSPPGLSLWVNNFLDRFKAKSGIEPMIYCNTNYAQSFFDSTVSNRDLWVANWSMPTNSQTGNPGIGVFSNWDFWQYDSPNGLGAQYGTQSTDIDLDVVNGGMSKLESYLIPAPEPASTAVVLAGLLCSVTGRHSRRHRFR